MGYFFESDDRRCRAAILRQCPDLRVLLIAVLHVFCLCASALVAGSASSNEVVDRIFQDWAERRNYTDTVRYSIEGETTFVRGFANVSASKDGAFSGRVVPNEDARFPVSLRLTFDFASNRVRKEIARHVWAPSIESFNQDHRISVYDGTIQRVKRVFTAEERSEFEAKGEYPIDIFLQSKHSRGDLFEPEEFPLFAAHGVIPVGKAFRADNLRPPLDRSMLHIHGTAVYRSRPVSVLRTGGVGAEPGSFRELWVDVDRDSAIVRFISYIDGKAGSRFDAEYKSITSLWLPSEWTYTRVLAGATLDATTLRVKEVDLKPQLSSDEFVVPIESGMVVYDPIKRDRYISGGPSGQDLPFKEAIAQRELESSNRVLVWVVVSLLLLAGFGALLLRRRLFERSRRVSG
jgi:hypothetical protein